MSQAGTVNSSGGGGGGTITFVTDAGTATTNAGTVAVNGAGGAVTSAPGNAHQIVITAPAVAGLLSNTVTVTAAQIKNLSNVPKALLPAPPAGQVYIIWYSVAEYLFGTIPFDMSSTALSVYYDAALTVGGTSGNFGMLGQSANYFVTFPQTWSFSLHEVSQANWLTYQFYLANPGGIDPPTGDGSMKITTYYTLLTVPF